MDYRITSKQKKLLNFLDEVKQELPTHRIFKIKVKEILENNRVEFEYKNKLYGMKVPNTVATDSYLICRVPMNVPAMDHEDLMKYNSDLTRDSEGFLDEDDERQDERERRQRIYTKCRGQ